MTRLRWAFSCSLLLLCFSGLAPAQTPSSAESPATPSTQPLPQAPSSVLSSPRYQPYSKPTRREDLDAYLRELIGIQPFLHAAIRSGIEQARTVPVGWGQDFPGYAQRFGSAYGEAAIDSTVRFAMGAALHEDVRYLICHHCPARDKFSNAILAEVTARHGEDGHRVFSPTPIVSAMSGPLIAYAAWYPPGYTSGQAVRHAILGSVTRIGFHLVREFLLDRDSREEKAARKAAASSTP